MRRYKSPFNGYRFLLNKNTGEIHDLDAETSNCRIDQIRPEHIVMAKSYTDCQIRSAMLKCPTGNGCFYCLPQNDRG